MRCAILDDYQNVALDLADWSAIAADIEIQVFSEHLGDEAAVATALADFEVVAIMRERTPFPRSLFDKLPKLKLLVTTGIRNLSIDVTAAAEHGVVVSGTEILKYPTAELTWGLVLAATRRIPQKCHCVSEGQWQTTLGTGLDGKTLGVIGLGTQGARVAGYGKAFAMEVLAWSQNLTVERCAEIGVTLVSKEELLARADVVTIHMVLGERSRGLIGAEELALMKPGATLVNTSRGPIVDEAALIKALKDGTIAGAGLDVFDQEPLPEDHPLRRLPNAVVTPHIGYVTAETYRIFYQQTVEDIRAWLDGAPVRVVT